jgi:hypothetical protein
LADLVVAIHICFFLFAVGGFLSILVLAKGGPYVLDLGRDHVAASVLGTAAFFDICMRNRFVIVSGLPGSGKSTLAQKLAPTLGLPLFDKDTILEG